MRSRPVRNPIFLGLGTAAILAAGVSTTTAFAQPTPSPSGSDAQPPPTDPTEQAQSPELELNWVQQTSPVHAGTRVRGQILVDTNGPEATDVRLTVGTVPRAAVTPCATSAACTLNTVTSSGKSIPITVTIPTSMTSGTITLTATAHSNNAATKSRSETIAVTKRPSSDSSDRVTNNSSGDNGDNDSGDSNDSNNSNNSSGSNGSGNSGGTGGSTGGLNGTAPSTTGGSLPFAPPNTAGSLQQTQPNSAQFPQIAPPAADPATAAAAGQRQNMGALRAASPEPQELTFQRLASTQAAWLAALLVAFSLLLTQIRLGKPPEARRRKGVHRRTRSGVFQA